MYRTRYISYLFICILMLIGPANKDIQTHESGSFEDKGDTFQKKWSQRVLKAANGIDSFFGNDRIEDDA